MSGIRSKNKVCIECKKDTEPWFSKKRCRSCAEKAYGKINPVSDKRKVQLKEYSVLRLEFLIQHPVCMAKLVGCSGISTQVHHAAGRTNDKINETKDWMALCANCHSSAHEKLSASEARKLGLKK